MNKLSGLIIVNPNDTWPERNHAHIPSPHPEDGQQQTSVPAVFCIPKHPAYVQGTPLWLDRLRVMPPSFVIYKVNDVHLWWVTQKETRRNTNVINCKNVGICILYFVKLKLMIEIFQPHTSMIDSILQIYVKWFPSYQRKCIHLYSSNLIFVSCIYDLLVEYKNPVCLWSSNRNLSWNIPWSCIWMPINCAFFRWLYLMTAAHCA